MSQMRLDKYLADLGLGARRELKSMIRSGHVRVNGKVETGAETRVDPDRDGISLDGKDLVWKAHRYYMMDKPEGVVTATEDARERTVLDLLPPELKQLGLFPVGRLDKDTSGLLLLTNDGNFAHRVISPKSCVEKRYYARVEGVPDDSDAAAFAEGIVLRDGTVCLPAKLELLGGDEVIVTVTEGKYHQVRRMLASRGKPVLKLRRLSVGGLSLDPDLPPGSLKELEYQDLCTVLMEEGMEK